MNAYAVTHVNVSIILLKNKIYVIYNIHDLIYVIYTKTTVDCNYKMLINCLNKVSRFTAVINERF